VAKREDINDAIKLSMELPFLNSLFLLPADNHLSTPVPGSVQRTGALIIQNNVTTDRITTMTPAGRKSAVSRGFKSQWMTALGTCLANVIR
jgi:hypothetical protein